MYIFSLPHGTLFSLKTILVEKNDHSRLAMFISCYERELETTVSWTPSTFVFLFSLSLKEEHLEENGFSIFFSKNICGSFSTLAFRTLCVCPSRCTICFSGFVLTLWKLKLIRELSVQPVGWYDHLKIYSCYVHWVFMTMLSELPCFINFWPCFSHFPF